MELPQNVKQYAEELLNSYTLQELKAAATDLSENYRNAQRTGKGFIKNSTVAAAYVAARMPATFGAVYKALNITFCSFPHEQITTVMDIGAGTGAVCIAANELLNLESLTCIEREPEMINFGKQLTRDIPGTSWVCGDISESENYKADMVTAAFVLNELAPKQRIAQAKKMWNSAEWLLIIIESGTPQGFEILKEIKSALLAEGAFVVAPCTGADCPLPAGDWCHFTSRIARSRLHKAIKNGDAPYEDEKFCFIALSRVLASPVSARILRHPKVESGKITLSLCTENGVLQKVCRKGEKAAFRMARKASAGDKFEL